MVNSTQSPATSSRRLRTVLAAALLVAAIVAVYSPALRGDFIWDDDYYVYENRLLREPDGLWRIWFTTDFESQFFPLTISVFRAAYQLWGLETLGYHLLNVAVHALNSLLVWMLLARLGVVWAGVAAAVFALHPVQVESVAWITELKNLLSTTFYLLSTAAYLRFEDSSRLRWYLLAFTLFVLGLFSKTVACTLPGALLVIRWWRGKPIGVREVLYLLPLFVVGVGMGLFVAWYETSHIGTTGPEFELSLAERFLIAGRALWFYLGKLVLPIGLAFSYPRWEMNPANPSEWAWLIGAVMVAIVLWVWRERLGRGPAAGLAFFTVALSPMLGFVNYYTMRYSFVADHYQYLACLGPITVVTAGGAALLVGGDEGARRIGRSAWVALAGVLLAFLIASLGVLSWQKAHAYRNREALWRDTIANNPGSWIGHNNLGNLLVDQDRLDEALSHYERARRLNPAYADPYSNIGGILVRQGRAEEGIGLFEQAIALEPTNGDFHYNLATTLTELGRDDEAIATFESLLTRAPAHAPAHNNLGLLLAERGEVEGALEHYRAAVHHAPDNAAFHENLADALMAAGDHEGAAVEYRHAVRLAPDDPALYMGLAGAAGALGREADAIAYYEKVLALSPEEADAHFNLGVHLAAAGRLEDAAAHYREVLRITPEDTGAANNLGVVSLRLGEIDDAIGYFERALGQSPDDAEVRTNLALTLNRAGRIGAAIEVLHDGVDRAPEEVMLANALAWILATAPSERWRDGSEAVRLAEHVCALTGRRNPNYLDTLAAAYAETGRFTKAEDTVREAMELAVEFPELIADLKRRLALYETGQPHRER